MRESKPVIVNVSFKTKVKKEMFLYSWLLTKCDEDGKSEYIKNVLKEKMEMEEKE